MFCKPATTVVIGTIIIAIIVLANLFGCASLTQMADGCDPHFTLAPCKPERIPPKSESWDQENLKRNDRGCPTAIYHNNPVSGILEQCL